MLPKLLVECALRSRAVLRLRGSHTVKFLQGLLTKDVTRLSDVGSPPLYAALLNEKGRFMYDFVCHRARDDDDTTVLLDCPAASADRIAGMFNRFKLRSDVYIDDVSSDLVAVAAWTVDSRSDPGFQEGLAIPEDPRLPDLGQRGIVLRELWEDGRQGVPKVTEMDYQVQRFLLGVAEGPEEIPGETAVPLEYNIDLLNGVTFDKGCYLGQELIARTHFQGLVRKRVLPFTLESNNGAPSNAVVGCSLIRSDTKKSIGTVRGFQGGAGVAIVRLKEYWECTRNSIVIGMKLEDDFMPVTIWIPQWWPQSELPSFDESDELMCQLGS